MDLARKATNNKSSIMPILHHCFFPRERHVVLFVFVSYRVAMRAHAVLACVSGVLGV